MSEYCVREYIVCETYYPLTNGKKEVVGELVRCRDCKYNPSKDEWIHCDQVTWWNSPDDYCSKGKRKDT